MRLVLAGLVILTMVTGCGSSKKSSTVPVTEQLFYDHTVVFGNHSTLIAAGYNAYGQVGDGTLSTPRDAATEVLLTERVHGYASGANHVIAFGNNSTIYAWGCNFRGRLGVGNSGVDLPTSGDKAYSNRPIAVKMPNSVSSVAAGWNHSLAVAGPNRSVLSWGDNNQGQLGNGGVNNLSEFNYPYPVKGDSADGTLDRVVQVAAGGSHSLALREDGTVWTWGDNLYGQLGYATLPVTYSLVPQQVMIDASTPLSNVKEIHAAGSYSLALTNDGKVYVWGYNGYGQLAQPPVNGISRLTPAIVKNADGSDFIAAKVTTGIMHVMALTPAGEVWGWGFNERGQLGYGDEVVFRDQPTKAAAVHAFMDANHLTATDIYAFGNHSLARIGGKWYGWGDNGNGQLGQPVPENSLALLLTPVEFNPRGL